MLMTQIVIISLTLTTSASGTVTAEITKISQNSRSRLTDVNRPQHDLGMQPDELCECSTHYSNKAAAIVLAIASVSVVAGCVCLAPGRDAAQVFSADLSQQLHLHNSRVSEILESCLSTYNICHAEEIHTVTFSV